MQKRDNKQVKKKEFIEAALDYIDHAPCYRLPNKGSTLNEQASLDAYRETLKQFPINQPRTNNIHGKLFYLFIFVKSNTEAFQS